MKIGLDFGMTNSTISYYDEKSKVLTNFRYNAGDKEYNPTVIAYNKNTSEVLIGDTAKDELTNEDYDVYENFKLQIGKRFDEKIEGREKTPKEVTRDFIDKFLSSLIKSNTTEKIENIVITVPAIWFKEEGNETARRNIEKIFADLSYTKDEFRIESEPIAATAYFCYAYENHEGKKYNGSILVIDYGGGTLDVTLCKVESNAENNKITVLDQYGCGEDNHTNGSAGVAFDEAVIEKIVKDNNLSFKKGSRDFIKLRNSFERKKIDRCDEVTKQLKRYFKNSAIVGSEKLFSLDCYDNGVEKRIDVHCKDLDHCFKEVNYPKLKTSIDDIRKIFKKNKIEELQDNFRVLLVGGFSNFYAVEAAVKQLFAPMPEEGIIYADDYEDDRFKQPFDIKDRSFAISKGAAWIAHEMITVEHECPYDIGIVVYDPGVDKSKDKVIIEMGTKIQDKEAVKWADELQVTVYHGHGAVEVFLNDGRPKNEGRRHGKVNVSAKELFPNVDKKDNLYTIGFSVNKNIVPTIHIKGKYGGYVQKPLHELIEKIGVSYSYNGDK